MNPHTARAYGRHIETFGNQPLNRNTVRAYLDNMQAAGCSPATINQARAALRWLAREQAHAGRMDRERLDSILDLPAVRNTGIRQGNWLTPVQCSALLSAARTIRDRALLALLLGCGLRRSEAAALCWRDVQAREGRMVLADLRGKGGRIRTVPVPEWAAALLNQWKQEQEQEQVYGYVGTPRRRMAHDDCAAHGGRGGVGSDDDGLRAAGAACRMADAAHAQRPAAEGGEVVQDVRGTIPADDSATAHDRETDKVGELNGHSSIISSLATNGRTLYPSPDRHGEHAGSQTDRKRSPSLREGGRPILRCHLRDFSVPSDSQYVPGEGNYPLPEVRRAETGDSGLVFGITPSGVWWVVKQCARDAGIRSLAPHDLRRTYARLCRDGGASLEQVQLTLGHASLQTTERYLGGKLKLGKGEAAGDFINGSIWR